MPSYLWSAKDTSGREVTERVDATTPEEARDELARRGWTDLRLQSSEIHDFASKQVQAASDPAYRPQLTPQQEVAFLRGTAPGFWSKWWKSLRESDGTFLGIALSLAAAVYYRQRLGILLFAGLLLVIALLFPALHFWFRRSRQLFHKLHRARNWRRWNDVLALLEALKHAQKSRKIGIGEVEMARYRALALSGLGRLEEAVSSFTQAAETAKMPRWLFLCHLAGLYTIAEKYDEALKSYRQALAVATEKGVVCIDYGSYLVSRFNRPKEARELLAIAESAPLTDSAKYHLLLLRGLIAYREGDFVAAKTHMAQALTGLENHPKGRYFAYEPAILQAHGYFAVVNASLGDRITAQIHFKKSENYFTTLRLDEWIREFHAKMDAVAKA